MFRYFAGKNRRVAVVGNVTYGDLPVKLCVNEYFSSSFNRYGDFFEREEIAVCYCADFNGAFGLLQHFGLCWVECETYEDAEDKALELSNTTVRYVPEIMRDSVLVL